ncbi:Rossmann-fold NAD(P)-binding domain-containing protein [Streptomyces murinus]|uniref:SDR family NAD(P)-dependent oxidoreductase n=1 Tax=Streptomyces murinus TaxID=33900 RepID=UPI0036E117FB
MKLSAVGTGDPEVGRFGGRHQDGERAVRESGGAWTVLRPSSFASNSLGWAAAVRVGEPVPNLTGDGASGVIDPRDIAEVAVAALLDAGHGGRTYTLTGPEAISVPARPASSPRSSGARWGTRDLTPDEARTFLRTVWGFDDTRADDALAGMRYVRDGGNALVTEDVPRVLGRPARSFRQWAEDHQGAFRAA